MKTKYVKITREDIEGNYDLTEEALTRDLTMNKTQTLRGLEIELNRIVNVEVAKIDGEMVILEPKIVVKKLRAFIKKVYEAGGEAKGEKIKEVVIDVLTNGNYINGVTACEIAEKVTERINDKYSFISGKGLEDDDITYPDLDH